MNPNSVDASIHPGNSSDETGKCVFNLNFFLSSSFILHNSWYGYLEQF
jgi:hypothetical protein